MGRLEGVRLVGEPTPCHACGMAKACRAKVAKLTMTKAEKIGERFFVDTTGPFAEVATGSKYLFGAVDDYSGKLFMMFGARKSALKDFVEKLLNRVKETHGLPKYVKLDGGGENMAVRKFCNDHGIKVELTPPATPQYNGRIERRFAVVTSMAMALLWNAGFTSAMKKKLLPQALMTASFLNDLAPTARSKLSAQELWDGKRSKWNSRLLIEFGRVGLVKIKTKITGKLNDKAEAMIMVGYGNEYPVGTYKFYNPKTKRFVFSDSVTWSKFKRWEIHPSMDGIYLKAKNMNGDGIDDNDRKMAVDLEDEEAEREAEAAEEKPELDDEKINVNLEDDGTLRQIEAVEEEPERYLRRSKRLAGIPADGPSVTDGDAENNETSMNGIFLGMALCGDSTGSTGNEEKWLGDTGSQIHATGNVGMRVRNQKVLNNEPVKGCSGKIISATTSGDVTVVTDDGVMCNLNNIRIVPGLVKI